MNIGDKAPNFKLPNQDGQDVSLAKMKGKWVVLYFYPSAIWIQQRDPFLLLFGA
jgi:peroxiredoxin Q/BCP